MTATTISCSQASTLFAQFLQDWDGKLPSGWKVSISGNTRHFTRSGSTQAFTATPETKPTPAPTPEPTPSSLTCPGSFRVMHNDRIGAMSLPAGNYRITRLTSGSVSCPTASVQFAYFLDHDSAGNLPYPWKMNTATKTFYRGSANNGFRVKLISTTGFGASRYPAPGEDSCASNYNVNYGANVGGLDIPAGPYAITALGGATCAQAIAAANSFIASDWLPGHWTANTETGTFRRRGSSYGFRLDPLFASSAFTG